MINFFQTKILLNLLNFYIVATSSLLVESNFFLIGVTMDYHLNSFITIQLNFLLFCSKL
jgi:hypothetical protein